MDTSRFSANPEFESTTEQLADLMQLCVDEVARLQGKQVKPAPVEAFTPTRSAPPPLPEPIIVPAPVIAPVVVPVVAPLPPPPAPPAPILVPDDTTSAAPEVPTAPPAAFPVDPVPYTVTVSTSIASGGAFDGQVFITLQGANGTSTEVCCNLWYLQFSHAQSLQRINNITS